MDALLVLPRSWILVKLVPSGCDYGKRYHNNAQADEEGFPDTSAAIIPGLTIINCIIPNAHGQNLKENSKK